MNVKAVCNNQAPHRPSDFIRTRRALIDAVRKYGWMTWFRAARIDIDATPQDVGRRRLHVQDLDKPATVYVADGEVRVS